MRTPIFNVLKNSGKITLAVVALCGISACVTQNFIEDKPVVDRDFSDDQVATTRISLALGYLKMGNTAQAKYNLEKAKQHSPKLVAVYTAFAHYYESVGEYQQTEKSYLTALDLADDDANTLNNFGVFLCRQNRVDEAEEYFLKAIAVPSYIRVSESYENIALCYLKVEQFDKAEHALQRSIAHSPNGASSLIQMAQLQYAKADFEQSATYLSRFELATRRFTPQAIALAFKVQKSLGNEDIANNYATMLLKMYPDSTQAKAYLDNELAQIEADKLAIKYLKFKLIKSGAKINKKPIVVLNKSQNKANDGFKQQQPQIDFANNKLVNDATIARQTSQSIAKNSKIDEQMQLRTGNSQAATNATKQLNQAAVNNIKTISSPVNIASTGTQPKVNVNNQQVAVKKQQTGQTSDLADLVHVVREGDNLYQISLKYNVLINSIRRWNNLNKENIHIGQVLRLTKPE
ncbi:type IV pilus biogenesis/stability protein PilW [Thalassotalea sp. ND16A]|uniref:type IV pilus biogenesis/stability protein PilW n=1 Tax=Thalassotalea sp. ND16A TaxID=1535422 RepID=UPI00051D12B7|nr:type IV pilus biogenesis/stability protein PilW [Thalassotalea sp. ND16A]KGK00666.1 hypothetical protein ND16A_3426 [Thalassotalea sp. ND16A]